MTPRCRVWLLITHLKSTFDRAPSHQFGRLKSKIFHFFKKWLSNNYTVGSLLRMEIHYGDLNGFQLFIDSRFSRVKYETQTRFYIG